MQNVTVTLPVPMLNCKVHTHLVMLIVMCAQL